MSEHDKASANILSKRIFDIIQSIVEFVVVFIKIFLEMLKSFVKNFLPPKLKDISNEIVLITGTGHGIGRELALHYAAHGSTVICVDINEKNNEDTVKRAKRLNKGAIHSYICDVTDREAVLKLASTIKNQIGPVSVLVNNVGIMPTHPIQLHTPSEIKQEFDVNVFSQFWTLQAFLPHMKQQMHGHIIAISSIAGVVGFSNLVPYCATKFAIHGLMEALEAELREGPYRDQILTTTIYPYMTNTGLCKKPIVKFPSFLGLLDPKEVARCIVQAHRSNISETTIPASLLKINNWCRILPRKCGILFKDYVGGGVESDL